MLVSAITIAAISLAACGNTSSAEKNTDEVVVTEESQVSEEEVTETIEEIVTEESTETSAEEVISEDVTTTEETMPDDTEVLEVPEETVTEIPEENGSVAEEETNAESDGEFGVLCGTWFSPAEDFGDFGHGEFTLIINADGSYEMKDYYTGQLTKTEENVYTDDNFQTLTYYPEEDFFFFGEEEFVSRFDRVQ